MNKVLLSLITLVFCVRLFAQTTNDVQISWIETPESVTRNILTVKWGIKAKSQIVDVVVSLNGNIVKGINAVTNDGFDMKKSQVFNLQKGDNNIEIVVKSLNGSKKSSKIVRLIVNDDNVNHNDDDIGGYPSVDSMIVAAYQDDFKAQYLIGKSYLNGSNGFKKDLFESSLWFKKSAELQYAPSQFEFSIALLEGRGIMRNQARGINWLILSANNNYSNAQLRLGLCYEKGEGVKQDIEKAKEWYRKCPLPEAKRRLAALEKK